MEHNCNYDKLRLLVETSRLIKAIERHYMSDAEHEGHPLCAAEYKELLDDLKKHQHKLKLAVEGLAKEGKLI